jgi:limonene-1,2-epoxide hydrolase
MEEADGEAVAVRVVTDWHAALNGGDVARLVGLSDPAVAVGGPRGTGSGTQLLRDWVERTKIRLEPLRIVPRGGAVVVEQAATREDADPDPPAVVASVFLVRNGRVTSVVRYDDLETALWAVAEGDAAGEGQGEGENA